MTSINNRPTSMNLPTDDTSFCLNLFNTIKETINADQPIIILCIGTDRSTGDSLGPFIGHYLSLKPLSKLHVYGTIDQPVHAKNLHETIKSIYQTHSNPYVIAIDAALSSMSKVKSVDVVYGPLLPGAALQKELPAVGDISIKGYVNVSGFMEFSILQNTRLSVVIKMAKQIAQGLYYTDVYLKHQSSIFKLKGAQ
ncbi:spore protease YyaC [Piscibacillus salipiscarius]|uniref:Spore protease YyaC n=1 Tax=Piscibacillus salipiscarius TaxID=299480 RepID=A0ABW5Q9F3_9BACI